MLRLGASRIQSREMDLNDIFFTRLKLLVVMGETLIKVIPLGKYQRQAMLANALHIESESIDLIDSSIDSFQYDDQWTKDFVHMDQSLFHHTKRLADMIISTAKGFPINEQCRSDILKNLHPVYNALHLNSSEELELLRVA